MTVKGSSEEDYYQQDSARKRVQIQKHFPTKAQVFHFELNSSIKRRLKSRHCLS